MRQFKDCPTYNTIYKFFSLGINVHGAANHVIYLSSTKYQRLALQKKDFTIIEYTPTKADDFQMLTDVNKNPFDMNTVKITFDDVHKEWPKRKYPIVSEPHVKGYTVTYKICSNLYHKIFKDLKLIDFQTVIDTCNKNYPTLRKMKVLFDQLYDFVIKNNIFNNDYSTSIDVVQYKDRNPSKQAEANWGSKKLNGCGSRKTISIVNSYIYFC